MKCLGLIVGILLTASVAFANDAEGVDAEKLMEDIQKKELQIQAATWEFKYCNERMQNLSTQAMRLREELNKIRAELDEVNKPDSEHGDE